MARPATASRCPDVAAAVLLLAAVGCSSPSRAPETDVIEVERIDLTAPKPAAEESLVLPGAPAAAPAPTETVPAPESK